MDLLGLLDPSQILFGNTLFQYAELLGVVLLFVLLSKVVYFIFKNYVRRLTEKTATELDDILVDIVEEPFTMAVIILGVFVGATVLNPNTYVYSLLLNIVKIMIMIDVAWFLIRIIDTLLVHYVKPIVEETDTLLDDQLLPIVRKGVKVIIIALTIMFILSNFGYDITTLLAGLGVGGLAVALAAQDAVGNFIASLIILSDRPFKIKDYIKFGSYSGTVVEMGLRSTRIEAPDGVLLTVPNSKLATEIIENYSAARWRRVDTIIGLTYETSYRKLRAAMKELEDIAASTDGVSKYDVKFVEFAPSSLNIRLRYWIDDPSKYFDIVNEVNLKIKERFDKKKFEFAYPTQTVYIKK